LRKRRGEDKGKTDGRSANYDADADADTDTPVASLRACV